jgi:hypothetical protein
MLLLNLPVVFFYSLNEALVRSVLGVNDPGGSMVIFLFGGVHALVQMLLASGREYPPEAVSYDSNAIAMAAAAIGWVSWPSFNAVLVTGKREESAIYSTFLCLSVAIMATFAGLVNHTEKVAPELMVRVVLTAGIAVAASSDIIYNEAAATLLGLVIPYVMTVIRELPYPILTQVVIPATLGSLYSAIIVAAYAILGYNYEEDVFARFRHPLNIQIGIQVAGLFISLGLGAVSGVFAGLASKHVLNGWYEEYLVGPECQGEEDAAPGEPAYYTDFGDWDIELEPEASRDFSTRQLVPKI